MLKTIATFVKEFTELSNTNKIITIFLTTTLLLGFTSYRLYVKIQDTHKEEVMQLKAEIEEQRLHKNICREAYFTLEKDYFNYLKEENRKFER